MTNLLALLSRGYFPRELPPPFTSNDFASKVVLNLSSLPPSFTNKKLTGKVTCHNLARAGTLRRKLGIPNPILYFNLCSDIEKNWSQIDAHFQHSNLSRSIPTPNSGSGRALLPSHDHSQLSIFQAHTRATARFILRTDISRFYHSIYTHSIPWAIHGKNYAKANRQTSNLGNTLDMWIRNGQDSQTMGIPIGPDTSLVIAEVILCAADQILAKKLPGLRGFRHIDDYELGFATYSKAEAGISEIQEILNEYELELNPRKTKIIELPDPEHLWVAELRNFSIRTTSKGQKTDLISFFDRAFNLMNNNPEEEVLKYAVSRLKSVKIDAANWQLFQHLLMQCINVEPGTFTSVLSQLLPYYQLGWLLDLASVENVMNDQIIHQAPLNHGSEVAWAVWSCIVFNVSIGIPAAAALSMMEDSVVALLSLDANQRGLIPGGLNLNKWQSYMDKDELYDKQWLLSYEANVKGWLSSNGSIDHVTADPNFAFLKKLNVQFYDPSRIAGMVPTGVAPSSGIAPSFSLPY